MRRGLSIAAGVFALVNLAGAIGAVVGGEAMHAVTHTLLLLLGVGAFTALRNASRATAEQPAIAEPDARLQYLQESVDAIAVEVERIGEAQRFAEKVMAQQPPSNEPPKKS